ncbi:putative F-box/FBD/LRR-repeat protein At1g78760 [Lotus japonicus]|uniref:putative F-box/FBD/LRR-repeat protein At1g78760 n=1 Tax=Lotus japonicus TaxID=34305 RepID=UPI00258B1661|nr:putative F-box/FBD/LRR-repeat protein At1g78760 [Lotus japonicus]
MMKKASKTDMDRISNLPEDIVHDILRRLTMLDIARTSCLSKAWKTLGVSLPYLNIDPQEFGHYRDLPHGWFKDFMENKMRSMRICMRISFEFVFKFKLCLDLALVKKYVQEIERYIKLVFETGTIKEFEFQITTDYYYRYAFPRHKYTFSHHIYNVETLNVLRLSGMTLAQPFGDMKLSNLQILSLEEVNVRGQTGIGWLFTSCPMIRELRLVNINLSLAEPSEDMKLSSLQILRLEKVKVDLQHGIDWFFTSCPMLREIRLVNIGNLKNLKVYGLSHLKHLEIDSCHELRSVEIQAPDLQNLVLSDEIMSYGFILDLKIDSQTCKNLRKLTLCNSTIQGSTFSLVFSECINVVSLVLDGCMNFFEIRISSQKLRKLVVTRCFNLCVTDVSAPNLTSFSFCNFLTTKFCDGSRISVQLLEKIRRRQECMLDFGQTLCTKSIWISLWFHKFKDMQGQKMVMFPKSGKYDVVVLEDWSSMAELQLMSKMCEAAAKTIITTMSFLDLADYMLEGFYAGNKLEKVLTISSNDESKFYEALKKKLPETLYAGYSSVGIAETKVAAFLSDENIGSDIDDIDGYPVQVLLKKGITRSLKAIRFTILSYGKFTLWQGMFSGGINEEAIEELTGHFLQGHFYRGSD